YQGTVRYARAALRCVRADSILRLIHSRINQNSGAAAAEQSPAGRLVTRRAAPGVPSRGCCGKIAFEFPIRYTTHSQAMEYTGCLGTPGSPVQWPRGEAFFKGVTVQEYLELVRYVLENGAKKTDRTGTGTLSLFGLQTRYDLRKGFPLLT